MFGLGPFEILAIGAIAVMLYGKRLPEVGRTVGKSLADLRRQWATISRDLDVAGQLDGSRTGSARQALPPSRYDEDESTTNGPVFEPPQLPPGA
ncbi:MAG: twin-arginine translocase TatA/TatE family subunit [Planctomycetia bacterium]|jgi:sec-independent protein translocase protein TatA|nr:twin-arginine translocase TatA/TatE family subunit [Planctomycetia bacterium]